MGLNLRERKLIINGATESLPEYSEGKWLHGVAKRDIPGMITTGINFAGSAINSFGEVKSAGDILQESGTSVGLGSGFSYLKQNSIDAGAQMDELSKLNTANTLNTAASGASLGSAFGPIGAGIGGVVGGAVGFIGGLFRKNKMAERIRQALIQATRNNNFNLASAQTDYLTNQYNVEHDNTQDDMLYAAKNGKSPLDSAMKASGFVLKNGRYVFDGHAMMSNGEAWGHMDPFTGEVLDLYKVGRGRDNKDTVKIKMGDTPEEVQSTFVVTNKGGASQYTLATGDVTGGLQIGELLKMDGHNKVAKAIRNGVFDLPTDILTAKRGKLPRFVEGTYNTFLNPNKKNILFDLNHALNGYGLAEVEDARGKTPYYDYGEGPRKTPYQLYKETSTPVVSTTNLTTNTLSPITSYLDFALANKGLSGDVMKKVKENTINKNLYDKLYNDAYGISDNSNLANAITSGMGVLGGLSQILQAKNEPLNRPDTYAPNQYERQALDIYGWLNPATNRAVQAAAATEARNRYNINRMGGLSGAQKYLAAIQSGIGLQNNMASIIADTNRERNQYRSQLAGAMMNAGASDAQRRQNANQYLEEAYARAHGARTQMEQMGMQNILAAFNQYYKNLEKNNRFMRTMAYYDQDYDLRRRDLERGWHK